MDKEKAIEILGDYLHENRGILKFGEHANWNVREKTIIMDGKFTAEQLYAIAWWMQTLNKNMLIVNLSVVEGQTYVLTNGSNASEYICIGYGQDPSSGVNYVVGKRWDQQNNRTVVETHLLKGLVFKGNLPNPVTK